MTTPTRCHLDLGTINQVCDVVVQELRSQVCEWEQKALDAGRQGDYTMASLYSAWAFACDHAVSKVFSATGPLFHDALTALPVFADSRKVQLPNLSRSAQDCHLDDLAIEVASQQPCPDPSAI